jgi:23S rRNA pseudouridine1911/1915/1917 synthase
MKKHRVFTSDTSGKRLDLWLSEKTDKSRERIKEGISTGFILVNNKKVKASCKLKHGDKIIFALPPLPLSTATPEDIPLNIVFEDEWIIVVDKVAGMVVHPAPGHQSGTLVNGLLGLGIFACEAGDLRPGIVHRIDKETSGLLVVAKKPVAREGLIEQFKIHSIKRTYIALVTGWLEQSSGTFRTLHGRNPFSRMKYSSKVEKGKTAVTHYEVIKKYYKIASLVKVNLETGRTHQVRVHFSDLGFPIIGDKLYSLKGTHHMGYVLGEIIGRHALHATELGFTHPVTKEELLFNSPLPPDFQNIIDILEDPEKLNNLQETKGKL